MTVLLNERFGTKPDEFVLDCRDATHDRAGLGPAVRDLGRIGGAHIEESARAAERTDTPADHEPADHDRDAEVPAVAGAKPKETAFSRGLIDTYFRQMGDAGMLSREQETALAKRIEAAQQAVLTGLCHVPALVERIAGWAHEITEGRRRVADVIDLSTAGEEPADHANDDDENEHAEAAAGVKAAAEAALDAAVAARLETIAALGDEIGALTRKRIKAIARGRDTGKRSRSQLQQSIDRFAEEMVGLRLVPDRIAELIGVIDDERKALRHGDAEAAAVAARVGMPIPEFRHAVAEIGRAQRALRAAREEMVRSHLRLVVAIARKYHRKSALDLLDLVQEGNMGLMHAIEKFDYRRGVKVSTYAAWWIRQSIVRAMTDQGRTIRIPVHMTETAAKVLRERQRLYQKQGQAPKPIEIAAKVKMPVSRVEQILSMVSEPTSLDLPVGEDGDATLGDLIEAPDTIDPHAAAELSALKRSVVEALEELTPREQQVLRMRFGIGGSADHTLEEVGKLFGVTRERIRQIEAKALEKLRSPARTHKLASFVER